MCSNQSILEKSGGAEDVGNKEAVLHEASLEDGGVNLMKMFNNCSGLIRREEIRRRTLVIDWTHENEEGKAVVDYGKGCVKIPVNKGRNQVEEEVEGSKEKMNVCVVERENEN
ncbi:hypothetical protein Lal_00000920 [Lupinus albus]|nr:hypothetical protein Lal_00000920 [Lupinus albus]